jgi:nicotinate-nucleotide adenylyltransferase
LTTGRLGILGGTFDPIHLGHVDAARAAHRALDLDVVRFVPSHVPPHRDLPRASGYHRMSMVALAIQDEPGFVVSDAELAADGPSYTARTLRALHAEGWHRSQIFFIIGVDAFAEIASWYDYPGVVDEAHFVVVSRPGHSHEALRAAVPELGPRFVEVCGGTAVTEHAMRGATTRVFLLSAPTTDVSSTLVRARLAAGESLDGLVSPAVADYARRHALYHPERAFQRRVHPSTVGDERSESRE